MNLCPNHIRRLRIGDRKFGKSGTECGVEECFVVVNLHCGSEAFGNVRCFVFSIGGIGEIQLMLLRPELN